MMSIGLVEHPESASIRQHTMSRTWAAAGLPREQIGGRGWDFTGGYGRAQSSKALFGQG
jgi:hypothetical protein